jgi:hypothetical protein
MLKKPRPKFGVSSGSPFRLGSRVRFSSVYTGHPTMKSTLTQPEIARIGTIIRHEEHRLYTDPRGNQGWDRWRVRWDGPGMDTFIHDIHDYWLELA